METMNIDLPTEMKDFVRDEVNSGGYGSAGEFIRDLIRREQRRKSEARLETMLLDGLDSGPMKEPTAADWNTLRDRLKRRHSAGKPTA